MDINRYELHLTEHAILQGLERGITTDMIDATFRGGRQQRFGRDYVRFLLAYKHGTVMCGGTGAWDHRQDHDGVLAMTTCTQCGKRMTKARGTLPDGMTYSLYKCSCGERILDMKQVHELAEKYRALKRYHVKVSSWGASKGVRIPKDLVKAYGIKDEVVIIPQKDGMKIVTA